MTRRFFTAWLAPVASIAFTVSLVQADEPATKAPMLGSTVWTWDDSAMRPTGVGARRDIHDGPTRTLDRFECHISRLNAGSASHPPHQHAQEEFIILQDGILDVGINGTVQRIGPGSMFFFASNDWHNVTNAGGTPATYLVFNVATAATRAAPAAPAATSAAPGTLPSAVFDWDRLAARPTRTGERRDMFDGPSVTCANLECHVTTLRPGEAAHAAHHHPDEELIVVREGTLEATIAGTPHAVGRGGIVFIASGDEHGLRNAGDSAATYYVVRIVTERTPPAP